MDGKKGGRLCPRRTALANFLALPLPLQRKKGVTRATATATATAAAQQRLTNFQMPLSRRCMQPAPDSQPNPRDKEAKKRLAAEEDG